MRDRTEMAAGADDHRRLDECRSTTHSSPSRRNVAQGLAQEEPRARSSEQVVVEFEASNAVADRVLEIREEQIAVDRPGAETRKRLDRSADAVVRKVQLQSPDDGRRDPSRAHLVPRKVGLVENRDIAARAGPGAARSSIRQVRRRPRGRHIGPSVCGS